MAPENSARRLDRFRARLMGTAKITPSDRAITALEIDAQRLVSLYFQRDSHIRPSAMAREYKAMAKGLRRAAEATRRLGRRGMLNLFAVSDAASDLDSINIGRHVDYLERIAGYAEQASEAARLDTERSGDSKGGRTADQNLRELIVVLMDRYGELLSIRPTHMVDKKTGLGESPFDLFVKEALAQYAPDGVVIEARTIDDAITWALPGRELEPFTPPPLPEI